MKDPPTPPLGIAQTLLHVVDHHAQLLQMQDKGGFSGKITVKVLFCFTSFRVKMSNWCQLFTKIVCCDFATIFFLLSLLCFSLKTEVFVTKIPQIWWQSTHKDNPPFGSPFPRDPQVREKPKSRCTSGKPGHREALAHSPCFLQVVLSRVPVPSNICGESSY